MDSDSKSVFVGNLRPQRICEQLSVLYDTPIVAGETLLFFDEIQSCLPAISSLRFFYEQYPELHIIAAGSLLEFALSELPSFGVGRVTSLFLYPFSFGEFLHAANADVLRNAIADASPQRPLSEPIHNKALDLYKRFLILGGMPKVVSSYFDGGDLLKCQRVLDDLIYAYEDDFAKYKKRVSTSLIRTVFRSVVEQNGQKFVYSNSSPELNRLQVKAGTKGSMQSLYLFMDSKKIEKGIRISQENFTTYGNIEVYPLYAIANLNKLKRND